MQNPKSQKKPSNLALGRSPWLLALAVLVLVGVVITLGWLVLGSLHGEQALVGDGIRLSVPGDWEKVDLSDNQACQVPGLECVVELEAPQGYTFNITWYEQPAETTVQAVDEREWKSFRAYYPNAVLLSKTDLQVGGLPAIQRVFLQNDSQNIPVYLRQVYVLDGRRLYLLTARFQTAGQLEAQTPVIDALLQSITFTAGE